MYKCYTKSQEREPELKYSVLVPEQEHTKTSQVQHNARIAGLAHTISEVEALRKLIAKNALRVRIRGCHLMMHCRIANYVLPGGTHRKRGQSMTVSAYLVVETNTHSQVRHCARIAHPIRIRLLKALDF